MNRTARRVLACDDGNDVDEKLRKPWNTPVKMGLAEVTTGTEELWKYQKGIRPLCRISW